MAKEEARPAITIEDLLSIDLVALKAEIDALEADLAEEVAKRRRAIDGRLQLMKTVSVLQNGKPQRQKRGPNKPKTAQSAKPSTEPDDSAAAQPRGRRTDRDRIADLLRARGAMQAHQIGGQLALSEGRVSSLLNTDPIFEMNPQNGRWSVVG